jgi:hypothetical protein
MEVPQKHVLEGRAPSKFTTLVGADTANVVMAVLDEELLNDVKGRRL